MIATLVQLLLQHFTVSRWGVLSIFPLISYLEDATDCDMCLVASLKRAISLFSTLPSILFATFTKTIQVIKYFIFILYYK